MTKKCNFAEYKQFAHENASKMFYKFTKLENSQSVTVFPSKSQLIFNMDIPNRYLLIYLYISTFIALSVCQLDIPRDNVKFIVECEPPSDGESSSKLVKVEVQMNNNEVNWADPIEYRNDNTADESINSLNTVPFSNSAVPTMRQNLEQTSGNLPPVEDMQAESSDVFPVFVRPDFDPPLIGPGPAPMVPVPAPIPVDSGFAPVPIGSAPISPVLGVGGLAANGGTSPVIDSLLSALFQNANLAQLLPPVLLPPVPIDGIINGITSLMNRNSAANGRSPFGGNLGTPNVRESLLDSLRNPNLRDGSQNPFISQSPIVDSDVMERLFSVLNRNPTPNGFNSLTDNNRVQSSAREKLMKILNNPDGLKNRLNSRTNVRPFAGTGGAQDNIRDVLSSLLKNPNGRNTLQNRPELQSIFDNLNPNGKVSLLLNRNSNPSDLETSESVLDPIRERISKLTNLSNNSQNRPRPNIDPTVNERISSLLNRISKTSDSDTAKDNENLQSLREKLLDILKNRNTENVLQNLLRSSPSLNNSSAFERISSILNRNSNSNDIDDPKNDAKQSNIRESLLEILRNPNVRESLQNFIKSNPLANSSATERLSSLLNRNSNSNIVVTTDESQQNLKEKLLDILKNSNTENVLQNLLKSPPSFNSSTAVERLSSILTRNSNSNNINDLNKETTQTDIRKTILTLLENSKLRESLQDIMKSSPLTNSSATERLSTLLNRISDSNNLDSTMENGENLQKLREKLLDILKNRNTENVLQILLKYPTLFNSSTAVERLSMMLNRNSNSNDVDGENKETTQSGIRETILTLLENSKLRDSLQDLIKSNRLTNSSMTERLASLINRNSDSNNLDPVKDHNESTQNLGDKLLDILKNRNTENLVQDLQKATLPLSNSTGFERISSILNRNSNTNDNDATQSNIRDSLLEIMRNSNLKDSIQSLMKSNPLNNASATERLSLLLNRNSDIMTNNGENIVSLREKLQDILKNRNTENVLQNLLKSPSFSNNFTMIERLSTMLNRNSNFNDFERSNNEIAQSDTRESLLEILRNTNVRDLLQNLVKSSPLTNLSATERLGSLLNRNSESNNLDTATDSNENLKIFREKLIDILNSRNMESISQNILKSPLLSNNSSVIERLSVILNKNFNSNDIQDSNNKEITQSGVRETILTLLENSRLRDSLQDLLKSNRLTNSSVTERLSSTLNRNSKSSNLNTVTNNTENQQNLQERSLDIIRNLLSPASLENSPIFERLSTALNRNSNDVKETDSETTQSNIRESIIDILRNSNVRESLQNIIKSSPLINSSATERLSTLLNRNSDSNNLATEITNNGILPNLRDILLDILQNSNSEFLPNLFKSPASLSNSPVVERLLSALDMNLNNIEESNNETAQPNLIESLLEVLRNSNVRESLQNRMKSSPTADSPIIERLSSLLNRNSDSNRLETLTDNSRILPNLRETLLDIIQNPNAESLQNLLKSLPSLSNTPIIERLSTATNRNNIEESNSVETQPNIIESILGILRNSNVRDLLQNRDKSSPLTDSSITERLSSLLNRNSDSNNLVTEINNGGNLPNIRKTLLDIIQNPNAESLQNLLKSPPSLSNTPIVDLMSTVMNRNNIEESNNVAIQPNIESILGILRNTNLRDSPQNQVKSSPLTDSSITERLSSLLNRNSDSNNLVTDINNSRILSNIKETLLDIIQNPNAELLQNLLKSPPSLSNTPIVERLSTALNRNNIDDTNNIAMEPNIRESILEILRNSNAKDSLQNLINSNPLADSSVIERLSSLLNRNLDSNNRVAEITNIGTLPDFRGNSLDVSKNSYGESLQNLLKFSPSLSNAPIVDRLSPVLNRNSDTNTMEESNNIAMQPNIRESILEILRNSNVKDSFQNLIKSNPLADSSVIERLTSSFNRNLDSNNLVSEIDNFGTLPDLRGNLLNVLNSNADNLLKSHPYLNNVPIIERLSSHINTNSNSEISRNIKSFLLSALENMPVGNLISSQPELQSALRNSLQTKSPLSKRNSDPKDLETSDSIKSYVTVLPPYSGSLSLSAANKRENTNFAKLDPTNDFERTSKDKIFPIPLNYENPFTPIKKFGGDSMDIRQLFGESKPIPKISRPITNHEIENNIQEAQTALKQMLPPMFNNPLIENLKPLKFQYPKTEKIQKSDKIKFQQPILQFDQVLNLPKPNINFKKPIEQMSTPVPLEKFRNSISNSRQWLQDNIGIPTRVKTTELPPLPPIPNLDNMQPFLSQIGPNGDLSRNTTKIINNLSTSMRDVINGMKTTSAGIRKVFNLPEITNSNSTKSTSTGRESTYDDTTDPKINDVTESQNTCDICNCLMKYVPKSVVNGKFIMETPKRRSSYAKKLPRISDQLNRFSDKTIIDNDEDMMAEANEQYVTYVLPPPGFKFNNYQEENNNDSQRYRTAVDDGIEKLTEFLSVVDRVDQFVSEKTKLIMKRLAQLTEDIKD